MKIAVHYPNIFDEPDSVFWVQDGKLQSFSTKGRLDPGYLRARVRLASVKDYEEAFVFLSEHNPYPDVWDVVETDAPREWLQSHGEST